MSNLYEINNNSGFPIYYVWVESFSNGEHFSTIFVDVNNYDQILDYYKKAKLNIKSLFIVAEHILHFPGATYTCSPSARSVRCSLYLQEVHTLTSCPSEPHVGSKTVLHASKLC